MRFLEAEYLSADFLTDEIDSAPNEELFARRARSFELVVAYLCSELCRVFFQQDSPIRPFACFFVVHLFQISHLPLFVVASLHHGRQTSKRGRRWLCEGEPAFPEHG